MGRLAGLRRCLPGVAAGVRPVGGESGAFFFFDRASENLSVCEIVVGRRRRRFDLKVKCAFANRMFARWYVEGIPIDCDLISGVGDRLEGDLLPSESSTPRSFTVKIARYFGQSIDLSPAIDTGYRPKVAAAGANRDKARTRRFP